MTQLVHSHLPCSEDTFYVLTCLCLLNIFPGTIPLPDRSAEMVIQAYLKHIYATFSGSLTLVTDNGGEFKNDPFQKHTRTGHQAWIYNSIPLSVKWNPRKVPFFLKDMYKKTYLQQIRLGGTAQLLFFSIRMLPSIHSKEIPFFLLFGRAPVNALHKWLYQKLGFWGVKRSLCFGGSQLCLNIMMEKYMYQQTSLDSLQNNKIPR